MSSPKDQASKQAYALEVRNIKQNNAKELNAILEKLWNIHDENLFVAKISMQYEIAKNRISEKDLYDRTLMVGGGSPPALKAVQHRLINSGKVDYFNRKM